MANNGRMDRDMGCRAKGKGACLHAPRRTGTAALPGGARFVAAALALALAAVPAAFGAGRASARGIAITPVTRHFGVEGGGASINTAGSGTWTASSGAAWIKLEASSGPAGNPVPYTVRENTDAEPRTGTLDVSGNTHTVTQDGVGASISPSGAAFDTAGGTGRLSVAAPAGSGWRARANDSWLSVAAAGGTGPGTLSYTVAAFGEVSTRQGTLTVAGNTFTVTQTGRPMKLAGYSATTDYHAGTVSFRVVALASTTWSVATHADWISVADAGSGTGSGSVTLAIPENPNWQGRTGKVSVGTETCTVTQTGRTTLAFSINPTSASVPVEGAKGTIAVAATPGLPWTAASGASWLTLQGGAGGAGNGSVAYSAAPNPSLDGRTGTIRVTPGDSSVGAKTLTVTQPAATPALSAVSCEFEAAGESFEVAVSVPDFVQWQVVNGVSWLTVAGATSRTGPGTVKLTAAANNTVQPRSGTVTIARQTFTVTQKARGVEVEYDTKLFGTDGGDSSISVRAAGNVSWTAVASDKTWITIYEGVSGKGDGIIRYIVSPYVGDGSARTGTIAVGDKAVWITQRPYDLSISPNGAKVEGNNGAGEFGVAASLDAVWEAIATEGWIILERNSGTGSGTVLFSFTENDTGKTRWGKIIVAGEVYTLEQKARKAEAFPAAATDAKVAEALAGAADSRLAERLETVAAYDAFRAWVADKGLDPWAVKASAHAWPSHALGAGVLFENEPDIELGGVSVERKEAGTVVGVIVTVKDGGSAGAVDAGKVAALFQCTSDLDDWEGTAMDVSVTATGVEDESLLFEVMPESGKAERAFLRIAF